MKWPEDFIGKVIQGDCLEVMRDMPDKCVDMVFMSPPYNLVREGSGGGANSKMKALNERYDRWYPDSMPEEKYQEWQKNILRECLRTCRGSVFYNHKVRYAISRRNETYHPIHWTKEFPLWCEIIWDRCGGGGGNSGRYILSDERILQLGRPKVWNGPCGYTNIWRFPPVVQTDHVCAFPIELPMRAIQTTTSPGDIIFDPFCGSGTTCAAAARMNRRWIGSEIVSKYCAIARERIAAEQAQGKLF